MLAARSILLASLGAAGLILQSPSVEAGTLQNFTVTLSDYSAGAHANVTISYTTQTALQNDILALFALPIGFTLVGGTSQSFCTDNITVSINNQVQSCGTDVTGSTFGLADLQLNEAPLIAAGSNIVITLSAAIETNPASGGVYQINTLKTEDIAGNTIDIPAVFPTLTIHAPPPVPALSNWAMVALAGLIAGTGCFVTRRRLAEGPARE
jgi:hypothetical protein